jgi:LDH2 family malate/lactate/ureidoglycolate dehydrogenase
MKKLRTILTILFLSVILCGLTSCEVGRHTGEGRHRRHNGDAVIVIDKDHQNGDHHNDDHHNDDHH